MGNVTVDRKQARYEHKPSGQTIKNFEDRPVIYDNFEQTEMKPAGLQKQPPACFTLKYVSESGN